MRILGTICVWLGGAILGLTLGWSLWGSEATKPVPTARVEASAPLARRIEALPYNPTLVIVHDLIQESRAQDASRRNGYSWPDTVFVDSVRIKLNAWVLRRVGEPELPLSSERPLEPAHPKRPCVGVQHAGLCTTSPDDRRSP